MASRASINKYYKNFIMWGVADYHCLLCDETFSAIEAVEKHIRWENHRKIAKNQACISKFPKDKIYKIRNMFYCELCNVVKFNMAATTDHIKDSVHIKNKENPKLVQDVQAKLECKRDIGYVVVADIIVSNDAWNALERNHCLICDFKSVDKDQLDIHVTTSVHIINLIQAKVVRENEDRYYRKIKPDIVYCLLCKKTVPTDVLSAHWDEEQHIKNSEEILFRTTKYTSEKEQQKENTRKLMEEQKLLYDINVRAGEATCKKCQQVVKLRFTEMKGHQDDHANNKSGTDKPKEAPKYIETSSDEEEEVVFSYVADHGKRRSELAKYGKKHNIRLNAGGSIGYCHVCHAHLSAHIRIFKQHVKGYQHRGHLELKGLKKKTERKQHEYTMSYLKDYLDSVFYCPKMQLLWLNVQFGIAVHSFLLVAPLRDVFPCKKALCYVCNIQYDIKDNESHLRTIEHKTNVIKTKVVASAQREFVREVRPNLFHCGFCNRLIAYYDNVIRHFKNWVHRAQHVNKDLTTHIAKKKFNGSDMSKFANDPDIMYSQLITKACLDLPKGK